MRSDDEKSLMQSWFRNADHANWKVTAASVVDAAMGCCGVDAPAVVATGLREK